MGGEILIHSTLALTSAGNKRSTSACKWKFSGEVELIGFSSEFRKMVVFGTPPR